MRRLVTLNRKEQTKVQIRKPTGPFKSILVAKDGVELVEPQKQLDFIFRFFQRVNIVVFASDIPEMAWILETNLPSCQSFALDLRFRDFECFSKLEKFMGLLPFKVCAEIHLDGEDYMVTGQSRLLSLFSKCI
jgi:hypothetical protein